MDGPTTRPRPYRSGHKKVRPRIAPRPAAVPGYIRPNSIRFQLFSYLSPGSTLWRIDNNTLANDTVHRLSVDIGPNHFEFELVISGQRLAGFRWQQLGPSLNIKSCMSGSVNIGVPHFDPGL